MKELLFARVCAVILLATASAKLLSLGGEAKLLMIRDPLLNIRYDHLFLVAGLVELGVACELWRSASRHRGLCWLFCLSMNFLIYRGLSYIEGTVLCPCLGTFSDMVGLPPSLLNTSLFSVSIGMLAGSTCFLWRRLSCSMVSESAAHRSPSESSFGP